MLRRSAPILLGLVVCLFAVLPSGATSTLRLDESKIRVALERSQSSVALEVESPEARTFNARVHITILDPRDKVRAEAASDVSVRAGKNSFSVPIKLPYSQLLEAERKEFPWYRLRYSVTPNASAPVGAIEGVVSLSEITPDLFELRVVAPQKSRAGEQLSVRVRAINPVSGRGVNGVAVSGGFGEDDGSHSAKASAVTEGDGYATLNLRVPRDADDDVDLKVSARRGSFEDSADAEVSVEEQPRIILTTDKTLYQPGQTMHVRALVFDPSEHAVAGEAVTLKLEDEDSSTVFSTEAKTSRYGIATADWPIPESTKLGSYTISIEIDDSRFDADYGPSRSVRISRYELPNFTVTTKPDRAYYLSGQNAEVEVRGDYLFGQPVKRGTVRVVRQTERRWDYKEQKYVTEERDPIDGVLDEQGRFVARLDLSAERKELNESSYMRFEDLTYAAYVTDPTTNRTEQRRFNLRLTKDPIHVYVNEGRYNQTKGLPLAFYVSASYADGAPAECEISVIEEGATTVTQLAGEPRREVKEPDRTILKVRTNRYGVAKVFGPVVSKDETRRSIPLRFVARDGEGRTGHYEDDLWLEHYWRAEVAEIRVETDKSIYREGEPINVELTSDAERLSAVADVTVGGRVVYSKPVRLSGGRASLVIPSSAEFRGAVTVSATGTDFYNKDDAGDYDEDYGAGSRTIVFPRDRELKLDVRMSQAKYQPGDDAVAQLSVKTASGRRAEGALGVVVFDKAVEERARTEDEFSNAWGFSDALYGLWYSPSSVAGLTQRDIERLDASRAIPEGLDEVAELLYNSYRGGYGGQRVFGGTHFMRSLPSVFQQVVTAQLAPVRDALKRRYDASGEYPADDTSLARILSAAGVDLASFRDPWGRPYHTKFYFEREQYVLEIMSDGADKRAGTEDDFGASGFTWPYFKKVSEAIGRAAEHFHARTGGYIRDLSTLGEELRHEGIDLKSLRDPWGQAYSFEFGVDGSFYTIVVRSSGLNRSFELRDASETDDFTLSTTRTDYFTESRASVDNALAQNLHETGSFPQSEAELRAALKRQGVDYEALRDAFGNSLYATFAARSDYVDTVTIASLGQTGGASNTRREIKPVTELLRTITLRSAGPDRQSGTQDDYTLGYFTSIATQQSGSDAKPQAVEPVTTFSGGTGAITGKVLDPNGAVVPNANVIAKHKDADLTFTATSNEEGVYLLRNLPSGLYDLTCTSPGFKVSTITSVQVQSSNLTKADFYMNVAATAETVQVSAAASDMVNASTSSLSKSVEKTAVSRMPISTPRLREFFPETLVWQPSVETDREGRAQVSFKLADNITTWKMSVIASTEDGRIGTYEKEFISSQPFFIEHDPPRVLTEGDRISLPVVLRNYLERAQPVEVEMKPESWFALEGPARQRAEVPAGDAARPVFDFRAVASVKDGKQRVTALASDASDAIEKPVTVHPDGEERALTASAILTDTAALDFKVPADVVRGSVRSELKVYPNLSAHLLEGVEAIMERPYGCGEQTISSSYPSVLALRYFERDGKLDVAKLPPLGARALRYTRLGYERLLRYRAPGGGFTYWGHGEPDVALTAYALRFLSDASRFIDVDEDVIKETRAWLLSRQRADGSWRAYQWWNNAEDARQTALTTAFIARVLAATRETEKTPAQTQTNSAATQRQNTPQLPPLERALRYLAARISEIDEPYLIASYALASADAGDKDGLRLAADKLVQLAHDEGAGVYWSLETNTPFYGWGLAGRIETTALAVKALNERCKMEPANCSVTYKDSGRSPRNLRERGLLFLLGNKDKYGVWYSTQATVNVHETLASLIANDTAAKGNNAAEIFVNGRRAGSLEMPPSDMTTGPILFDLSPYVSAGDNRVEVKRAGPSSQAQAQVVTDFYVPWKRRNASDGTTANAGGEIAKGGETSTKSSDASSLRLAVSYDHPTATINQEVTCSITAERTGHKGYGMMLAEIGLPPGADVDRASLDDVIHGSDWSVSSYDVLPDRLVVYLWPASGGVKFSFKFRPRYGLDALTSPSTLYDYYNPEAYTVVPPTRFVVR